MKAGSVSIGGGGLSVSIIGQSHIQSCDFKIANWGDSVILQDVLHQINPKEGSYSAIWSPTWPFGGLMEKGLSSKTIALDGRDLEDRQKWRVYCSFDCVFVRAEGGGSINYASIEECGLMMLPCTFCHLIPLPRCIWYRFGRFPNFL